VRQLQLLTLFLIALSSCGSPSEEVVSKTLEGGDTTTNILKLEYLDLELPERQYLVFRQELSLLDVNGFLGMESEALSVAATRAGVPTTGPMTSLFYEWDTEKGWADAAVAVPVEPGTQLAPYVTISLPRTRALALDMKGGYDAMSAMHVALTKELQRRGLQFTKPSIEEYEVGPLQTQDPDQFRTRIIYPYETPDL